MFHQFFTNSNTELAKIGLASNSTLHMLEFIRNIAQMSRESSAPLETAPSSVDALLELETIAQKAIDRYAGKGWQIFDEMASELGWPRSQLTSVLRWLRHECPDCIAESRTSGGIVKVRITKVPLEAKQARQLSTDIVAQLAKLYAYLKHTERNREKLALDVSTIACRIAPFLEDREFQIQYKRCKRQLKEPLEELRDPLGVRQIEGMQMAGTQLEAGVDSSNSEFETKYNVGAPRNSKSSLGASSPTLTNRLALPKLIGIVAMILAAILISIFLVSTFLRAMELLSHYVERINSQAEL